MKKNETPIEYPAHDSKQLSVLGFMRDVNNAHEAVGRFVAARRPAQPFDTVDSAAATVSGFMQPADGSALKQTILEHMVRLRSIMRATGSPLVPNGLAATAGLALRELDSKFGRAAGGYFTYEPTLDMSEYAIPAPTIEQVKNLYDQLATERLNDRIGTRGGRFGRGS